MSTTETTPAAAPLTDDEQWQMASSMVADMLNFDEEWTEKFLEEPVSPHYLRELANQLLSAGWRFAPQSDEAVQRELAKARVEIAKLQQALSVAERHDADVRLEAEADVRAELAEKVTA